jgi:hypothetical protein
MANLSEAQSDLLRRLSAEGYVIRTNGEGFVDQADRPVSTAIVRTLLRLRVLVEDASDVLFAGLASQILRLNQLLMSGSKGSESR